MFPKFPTNTCFPKNKRTCCAGPSGPFPLVRNSTVMVCRHFGMHPGPKGYTNRRNVSRPQHCYTEAKAYLWTYGKCSTLFNTGLCPTLARMLAKSLNGTNASRVLKVSRAHGISIRRCCFCMLLLLSETMYWNELQPEASKDCSNISGQDSASFGLCTVPQVRACTCLCGYGSR